MAIIINAGNLDYESLTINDVDLRHKTINYYSRRPNKNLIASISDNIDSSFNSKANLLYCFEKTKGRCWSCGENLFKCDSEGALVIENNKLIIDNIFYDHLIPLSGAGATTIGNLAFSCVTCNGQKGNKSFSNFVNEQLEKNIQSPFYSNLTEAEVFLLEYSKPWKKFNKKLYKLAMKNDRKRSTKLTVDENKICKDIFKIIIDDNIDLYFYNTNKLSDNEQKFGPHSKYMTFLFKKQNDLVTGSLSEASKFFILANSLFSNKEFANLNNNEKIILFNEYIMNHILSLKSYTLMRDNFRKFRVAIDYLEDNNDFIFISELTEKFTFNDFKNDMIEVCEKILDSTNLNIFNNNEHILNHKKKNKTNKYLLNSNFVEEGIVYSTPDEEIVSEVLNSLSNYGSDYSNYYYLLSKVESCGEFNYLMRLFYINQHNRCLSENYSPYNNQIFNDRWRNYRNTIRGRIVKDEQKIWFKNWDKSARDVFYQNKPLANNEEYLVKK